MKKIIVLTILVMLATLPLSAVAGANDVQLTEKEKGDIKTTAKMFFPKHWVSFYKTRIFVRDAEGFIVTFKVLPVERKLREIEVRPGFENFAFMFLLYVADFINCPAQAPSAFGKGVVNRKN